MVQQPFKLVCYYMLYRAVRVLNLESIVWDFVDLHSVLGKHVPGNFVSADRSVLLWVETVLL